MSAECRKCGHDLDIDFNCGACDMEKKYDSLLIEVRKLRNALGTTTWRHKFKFTDADDSIAAFDLFLRTLEDKR